MNGGRPIFATDPVYLTYRIKFPVISSLQRSGNFDMTFLPKQFKLDSVGGVIVYHWIHSKEQTHCPTRVSDEFGLIPMAGDRQNLSK